MPPGNPLDRVRMPYREAPVTTRNRRPHACRVGDRVRYFGQVFVVHEVVDAYTLKLRRPFLARFWSGVEFRAWQLRGWIARRFGR